MRDLQELLRDQAGAVARRQLLSAGHTPAAVRRLLRRRELTLVHPGVYLDHTGSPSWLQRAWAAVLYADRAALYGRSALIAWEGTATRLDTSGPIHIAVDQARHVHAQPDIVVHRVSEFEAWAQTNLGPPRIRYDEAVVDVAALGSDELEVVASLSGAVGARRTTPARLRAAVERRSRVKHRGFILEVLQDLDQGTHSVLEHGYLTLVERAHSLPTAVRQAAALSGRRIYRDGLYPDYGVAIELDGRLDHAGATARDHDLERDLDAAVDGLLSVRLGWGQIFRRPCLTAQRMSGLLRARGWTGAMSRCPRCLLQ